MCSISGIINGNIKLLKVMVDSQSHRAPDEKGFYQSKNIFIGMGRLKIIDLKSKNLCPFEDNDLVLSYNGEIYNYLELRQELNNLINAGLSLSQASKYLAKKNNLSKSVIYKMY